MYDGIGAAINSKSDVLWGFFAMSLSAINIESCVWTARWQARFMAFCSTPPWWNQWLTFSNHFFPWLNHFFPLFPMMKPMMKPLFGWLTFSNHFFPWLNHFFPLLPVMKPLFPTSGFCVESVALGSFGLPPYESWSSWPKAKSFLCSLSNTCLGAINKHGDWHDDHGNGMFLK